MLSPISYYLSYHHGPIHPKTCQLEMIFAPRSWPFSRSSSDPITTLIVIKACLPYVSDPWLSLEVAVDEGSESSELVSP